MNTLKASLILFAVAGVSIASPVAAQWTPSGPIHVIVPFAAGGGTDIMARVVASEVQKATGHVVIVENKPGASGMIGAAAVATSAPDGLNICVCTTSTISTAGVIGEKPRYDPEKDLAPVAAGWSSSLALYARKDLPARNVQELIAYAKANPNKLSFGVAGFGGASHLGGEMLRHLAGVTWTNVPFKGESEIISALLSGAIDFGSVSTASNAPLVEDGKLQALAVQTTVSRSARLPNLPMVSEQGFPEYSIIPYTGFNVAGGTPDPIIQTLSGWIRAALLSDAGKAGIGKFGASVLALGAKEYGELVRKDRAALIKLVKDANVKVD